ncbi:hypothetical protein KAFR_0D04510 [Kazachstania africana CBS 2517]|uniref:Fatty acid hydroxylase domain-containing protein n=1 Tax=Kazachstania africana (strain ATCC 22294 / BCRC 22015 / CBS 2517 / CECT 1963 / NBRC 1671 / NRRL Y-8276) TaxID=1071382 RepID=H2AUP9_KAZAF|nr:hypothetical protein KAFR_0D04510 [Kazachstania africana CBS 2517]CCF58099.1 hypothetical protein KAFR_0D04510 [Kazachstania africana CBS 2517]
MVNETVSSVVNSTIADYTEFFSAAAEPQIVLSAKPSLVQGIPDGILALIAPVVAYWTFSMFFHTLDTFNLAETYRIHPSEEVKARNLASRFDVLCEVILQHIIQSVVGYGFYRFDGISQTGYESNQIWNIKKYLIVNLHLNQYLSLEIIDTLVNYAYNYGISAFKIAIGFVIIDTWQYWLHRLMHLNKTLYKKYHSVHHELYVPYAYGALFNAPLEGFLLDTLGTGIAAILTGLSQREQIILYTFATMKTVDDHCGYDLPFDPFQMIFPNNSVYHDIHHQTWGLKSNFAQPFFVFWDNVCSTKFAPMDSELKGVKRINIHQYKKFLQNRENERVEKLKKFKESMDVSNEEDKKIDETKKKDM